MGGGGAHWAQQHREMTHAKYGKLEIGSKTQCLMIKDIYECLGTVSCLRIFV